MYRLEKPITLPIKDFIKITNSSVLKRRLMFYHQAIKDNNSFKSFTFFTYPFQDESFKKIFCQKFIITKDKNNLMLTIEEPSETLEIQKYLKDKYGILNTINDVILVTDADHIMRPGPIVLYVNKAFTKMTGYMAEEIIGKSPRILQGEETTEDVKKEIRQQLDNWNSFRRELVNYKKDGTRFHVEINFNPVKDEYGWYDHWVGIQRDITEKVENIHAKIEETRKRSIEKIASGISHDLNNFLTPAIISSKLIQRKTSDAKILELLKQIDTSLDGAKNLTQQFLSLSKGNRPLKETINLSDHIEKWCLLPTKGSKVSISINNNLKSNEITLDRNQISQVFVNLVLNAVQAYGEKPGEVKILLEEMNLLPSNSFKLENGAYLKITISDHAGGIKEKEFKKIFNPYFTTKESGNGIGLYVCKEIIENHNGHLEASSKYGEGTTFEIFLPFAQDEYVIVEDSYKKVLIVDDDINILNTLKFYLSSSDIEAEYFDSFEEARNYILDSIRNKQYIETCLFDMKLKGKNSGIDLIKLAKEIPNCSIYAMTGFLENEYLSSISKLNIKKVIKKPFELEELDNIFIGDQKLEESA